MQKKQLWILNAALAAFAVMLAMRLAGDWRRGSERYQTLNERSRVAATVPVVPISQAEPAAASEIVARNLFTPDRNNNRAQVSQSRPPLPVAIGTMRLPGGYEALMSEGGTQSASRFRRVKKGEEIGGYTVAEIKDEEVVVDYQGQRSEINVYQSAQSVARTVAPPVAASPSGPTVETAGSASAGQAPANTFPASTTSTATSGNASGGVAQPQQVTVTIEGNRKRFERSTAFGPQVWYEDIK